MRHLFFIDDLAGGAQAIPGAVPSTKIVPSPVVGVMPPQIVAQRIEKFSLCATLLAVPLAGGALGVSMHQWCRQVKEATAD
jgi:hypothetical protein